MPSTTTVNVRYPINGLDTSRTLTFQCEGVSVITPTLTGVVEDTEVTVNIDVSALQFLVIYSSVELTIKTNSDSAPDDTFTVLAGKPFLWYDGINGEGATNPITADVTAFYISKADSGTEVPEILIGQDATP